MSASRESRLTLGTVEDLARLQQDTAITECLVQSDAIRICKSDCEVFVTALRQEVDCAVEIGQLSTPDDEPNQDMFNTCLAQVSSIASSGYEVVQRCVRYTPFPARIKTELENLTEKLALIPLNPQQAAAIIRQKDANLLLPDRHFALCFVNHPAGTSSLWVSVNHKLECFNTAPPQLSQQPSYCPTRRSEWQKSAVVTVVAVARNGNVWTGHQDGSVAIHTPDIHRMPQPLQNSAITAIAFDEDDNGSTCTAWVGDRRGSVRLCQADPEGGTAETRGTFSVSDWERHRGDQGGQPSGGGPVNAIVVHKNSALLATGGANPCLQLWRTPRVGTGAQPQTTARVVLKTEVKHMALVPMTGGACAAMPLRQQMWRHHFVITAQGGELTIWCVEEHSLSMAAHLAPTPGPLPPVCGIHLFPSHGLMVTVHSGSEPALCMWPLPTPAFELQCRRTTDKPPTFCRPTCCVRLPDKERIVASTSDAAHLVVALKSGGVLAWEVAWVRRRAELGRVEFGQQGASVGSTRWGGLKRELMGRREARVEGHPKERVPLIAEKDLTRVKKIGEGSYGVVYLEKLEHLLVAVKMLKGVDCMTASQRGELSAALQREVKLLERVVFCKAFVRLLGWCPSPPMIITDYYAMGSLFQNLQAVRERYSDAEGSPLKQWHKRVEVAVQVASGMTQAHAEDLLHGDLRSSNIFLTAAWDPKIGDLGLARLLEGTPVASNITNPRSVAPELYHTRTLTKEADVYAFGVILWELLTFDIPYSNENTFHILYEKLHAQNKAHHPPIPEADKKLPHGPHVGLQAYLDIMRTCFAADPKQRPTFPTIAEELNKISNMAGLVSLTSSVMERKRELQQQQQQQQQQPSPRPSPPLQQQQPSPPPSPQPQPQPQQPQEQRQQQQQQKQLPTLQPRFSIADVALAAVEAHRSSSTSVPNVSSASTPSLPNPTPSLPQICHICDQPTTVCGSVHPPQHQRPHASPPFPTAMHNPELPISPEITPHNFAFPPVHYPCNELPSSSSNPHHVRAIATTEDKLQALSPFHGYHPPGSSPAPSTTPDPTPSPSPTPSSDRSVEGVPRGTRGEIEWPHSNGGTTGQQERGPAGGPQKGWVPAIAEKDLTRVKMNGNGVHDKTFIGYQVQRPQVSSTHQPPTRPSLPNTVISHPDTYKLIPPYIPTSRQTPFPSPAAPTPPPCSPLSNMPTTSDGMQALSPFFARPLPQPMPPTTNTPPISSTTLASRAAPRPTPACNYLAARPNGTSTTGKHPPTPLRTNCANGPILTGSGAVAVQSSPSSAPVPPSQSAPGYTSQVDAQASISPAAPIPPPTHARSPGPPNAAPPPTTIEQSMARLALSLAPPAPNCTQLPSPFFPAAFKSPPGRGLGQ